MRIKIELTIGDKVITLTIHQIVSPSRSRLNPPKVGGSTSRVSIP